MKRGRATHPLSAEAPLRGVDSGCPDASPLDCRTPQTRRSEDALGRPCLSERPGAPAPREKDPACTLPAEVPAHGPQSPEFHAGTLDAPGRPRPSRTRRRPRCPARPRGTPRPGPRPFPARARPTPPTSPIAGLQHRWLPPCSELGPAHPRQRASPSGRLDRRGVRSLASAAHNNAKGTPTALD